MLDLLYFAEINQVPSIFLALDVEKAFDRVHWGSLSKTLHKFGIYGLIHSAIMSLYSNPTAQVYTSSLLSDPFLLSNDTHQGCPLSPIIFSLIIEPLAQCIRSNETIQGIKIGHESHKIGLFADDIILMIFNSESCLLELKTLLHKFRQVSFYKVNTNKCFSLTLNVPIEEKNWLKCLFPYNWDPPSITYLGVQLTSSSAKLYSCNYPLLLAKSKKRWTKLANCI